MGIFGRISLSSYYGYTVFHFTPPVHSTTALFNCAVTVHSTDMEFVTDTQVVMGLTAAGVLDLAAWYFAPCSDLVHTGMMSGTIWGLPLIKKLVFEKGDVGNPIHNT